MTQDPITQPMNPQALTRAVNELETQVRQWRGGMCPSMAITEALEISDPSFGGNLNNLRTAAPQLVRVTGGRVAGVALMDIDRNGVVTENELTAGLLVATRIAQQQGVAVGSIPVEQVAAGVRAEHGLVQEVARIERDGPSCPATRL